MWTIVGMGGGRGDGSGVVDCGDGRRELRSMLLDKGYTPTQSISTDAESCGFDEMRMRTRK